MKTIIVAILTVSIMGCSHQPMHHFYKADTKYDRIAG